MTMYIGPDEAEIIYLEWGDEDRGEEPNSLAVRREKIPRTWARVDEADTAGDALRTADRLEHVSWLKRLVKESITNQEAAYRVWRDGKLLEIGQEKVKDKPITIKATEQKFRSLRDYPGWWAVVARLQADYDYLSDLRHDLAKKLSTLNEANADTRRAGSQDPRS